MAKVGKYELVRKLATGGMAEVFLAKSEWVGGLEKTVVVKRILRHLAEEPGFIEMFFSEARLTSQLSHPNVAQIIEFGEADGINYLAMEYVDGPSLRTLLKAMRERGDRIPFALCARIVASACEALAYAHALTDPSTGESLQIVHRDVSPDNILISKTGTVKLVDFGIAKATTQDHKTKTGVVKGKLAYMSPEQLTAESLDRRADIFSLGVVLYELIANAKPYDITNEVKLIHAILHEDRVPLTTRRPDTPPELERIVDRALERDRERRYADCRMMYSDLEQFLITLRQPVSAFQIAELVQRYEVSTRSANDSSPPRGTTPDRANETRPLPPPKPLAPEVDEAEAAESAEESTDVNRQSPAWPEVTGDRPAPKPEPKAEVQPISKSDQQLESTRESLEDALRQLVGPPVAEPSAQPSPRAATRPAWLAKRPIIGALGGVLVLAATAVWFPRGRTEPASTTEAGPTSIAFTPAPPAPDPPVQRVDVESRLAAAQKAMDKQEFDQVEDILEPIKNPDGTRPGVVEDLLRQAAEEKENHRKLIQAGNEMSSGNCGTAEKLLAESQGTLSFATDWQSTRAKLEKQCRKKAAAPAVSAKAAEQARIDEAEKNYEDGRLLLKKRQYRDAAVFFSKCLELDKNNAECHLALGSTYARLRDPEKGAQHYREFLRLAPTHAQAEEVRRLLQEYEEQRTKAH